MKSKITLVVLISKILLFITSCKSDNISFYNKEDVKIEGRLNYEGKELLIFSILPESLFYCSGVNEDKNEDIIALKFIQSNINNTGAVNVDYKCSLVKDIPALSKNYKLDPMFHFIELKEVVSEIVIQDLQSSLKFNVNPINLYRSL